MIGRLIAWAVFAALLFGAYGAVKAFKNPWASVSGASVGSPVLSMLPKASDGCGKECAK